MSGQPFRLSLMIGAKADGARNEVKSLKMCPFPRPPPPGVLSVRSSRRWAAPMPGLLPMPVRRHRGPRTTSPCQVPDWHR